MEATQKVMAPVWVSWTISFWEPSSSLGKIWTSYLSPSCPLINSWNASRPVWVGWLVDWLWPIRMISSPLLAEPAQPARPPAARAAIAAINERRVIFFISILSSLVTV